MPRPFIPQLSSQCTAALQPSNATEHRRRLFRGTPGQANEGSRAEGNTTQTKRRKTNAHRGHRACDRRKKNGNGTWTTPQHSKQSRKQSNPKTEQTRPENSRQTYRLQEETVPSPPTRPRCQQRKEKQRRKESCANTFVRIAGNP